MMLAFDPYAPIDGVPKPSAVIVPCSHCGAASAACMMVREGREVFGAA